MSYYLLPKTRNKLYICPTYSLAQSKPYISHSLYYYYNQLKEQLDELIVDVSNNYFENIIKTIHPYEFIFTKVPGWDLSISKLDISNSIFYDLFELYNTFHLFHFLNSNNQINCLHISNNSNISIECFDFVYTNITTSHFLNNTININNSIESNIKMKFIFYEINVESYSFSLLNCIAVILKYQENDGCAIIKIDHIFYKYIIDVIYLLSSIYDKIYISKPTTNNAILFERYIVCKNFICASDKKYIENMYLKVFDFLQNYNCDIDNDSCSSKKPYVLSIFDKDVPYYFKNKLEDLNTIIGQQQLDSLNQLILICKNKTKENKIDVIKKQNIYKCVYWCEKYKIPYNKLFEKINIFSLIANDLK
jgi:hypothetical protein